MKTNRRQAQPIPRRTPSRQEIRELEAIAFSDLAALFDDAGRPLKLRDLPASVRMALAWVECGTDGRIQSFAFKDKLEALAKLLALAEE